MPSVKKSTMKKKVVAKKVTKTKATAVPAKTKKSAPAKAVSKTLAKAKPAVKKIAPAKKAVVVKKAAPAKKIPAKAPAKAPVKKVSKPVSVKPVSKPAAKPAVKKHAAPVVKFVEPKAAPAKTPAKSPAKSSAKASTPAVAPTIVIRPFSRSAEAKKAVSPVQSGKPQKLTASELKKLRDELVTMRNRLTAKTNVMRQVALERNDEITTEEDSIDQFDRLFEIEKIASVQEFIYLIDEALHALDDGVYGTCQKCSSHIEKARIQALPFAKTCIRCQHETERQTRA